MSLLRNRNPIRGAKIIRDWMITQTGAPDETALNAMAICLGQASEQAQKNYEAALAANPNDARTLRLVADFFLRTGQNPNAGGPCAGAEQPSMPVEAEQQIGTWVVEKGDQIVRSKLRLQVAAQLHAIQVVFVPGVEAHAANERRTQHRRQRERHTGEAGGVCPAEESNPCWETGRDEHDGHRNDGNLIVIVHVITTGDKDHVGDESRDSQNLRPETAMYGDDQTDGGGRDAHRSEDVLRQAGEDLQVEFDRQDQLQIDCLVEQAKTEAGELSEPVRVPVPQAGCG